MQALKILAFVLLALCTLGFTASTATAQNDTTQKWTTTGWKSTTAGDIYTGNQVATAAVGGTDYYVVKVNGQNVFRVAKNDASLSANEKAVFDAAIAGGTGVSVTIGTPGVESVTG